MTLEELYEQQQQDIKAYEIARNKTWDNLMNEHRQVAEAFGSKDRIPSSQQTRMDKQIEDYHKEWLMHSGDRHKALLEQHHQQREALTGKPKPIKDEEQPAKAKNDNNPLNSEKQEKMQKIIAQQQAIRKHQQEKKRGR